MRATEDLCVGLKSRFHDPFSIDDGHFSGLGMTVQCLTACCGLWGQSRRVETSQTLLAVYRTSTEADGLKALGCVGPRPHVKGASIKTPAQLHGPSRENPALTTLLATAAGLLYRGGTRAPVTSAHASTMLRVVAHHPGSGEPLKEETETGSVGSVGNALTVPASDKSKAHLFCSPLIESVILPGIF
jgi:hypothetical protein